MLVIPVQNKNIENALKAFKNKVQKTKLVQELKDRQEYVKPSVRRRNQILKASFFQKKKDEIDKLF